jgi:hypothetical protein
MPKAGQNPHPSAPTHIPPVLSQSRAARAYGLSPKVISLAIQNGELAQVILEKPGNHTPRTVNLLREDIEKWLNSKRVKGPMSVPSSKTLSQ